MNFTDNVNRVNNWINFKAKDVGVFVKCNQEKINEKMNDYFESDSYEKDLDSLLKSFNCSYYEDIDFNKIQSRKSRIEKKEQQLKKKSMVYVGEGALKGFKASVIVGDPVTIGQATVGAASVHAGVIAIKATDIFIKRVINGYSASTFSAVPA